MNRGLRSVFITNAAIVSPAHSYFMLFNLPYNGNVQMQKVADENTGHLGMLVDSQVSFIALLFHDIVFHHGLVLITGKFLYGWV